MTSGSGVGVECFPAEPCSLLTVKGSLQLPILLFLGFIRGSQETSTDRDVSQGMPAGFRIINERARAAVASQ